ncbi:MAG: 2Fe-2S iron-sulfur cluster binding domain-containing protein, partial [Ruminococcus sp.]|nr:2Fe-2S iron-sulfur cluster binding domain-containing protein [Ruminococcus sp.]
MQLIIPAGVNVLEYVRQKGLFLPAYCSGAGECGKCRVKLIAGSLDITPEDRRLLQETQLSQGLRLACKAFTKSP